MLKIFGLQDETADDCSKGEGEDIESDEELVKYFQTKSVKYFHGLKYFLGGSGVQLRQPGLDQVPRLPLVARHGGLLPRAGGDFSPGRGVSQQRGRQVPRRVSCALLF